MRMLTIASQKGGAAKTTLAAYLAVEAKRTSAGPVAVVNTDLQVSLTARWNTCEARTPLFASVEITHLPDHLPKLQRHQVEIVVIDTPPALTDTIRAAIAVADLVLIPARPGPHDLRAVGVIVEMAEAASISFCFVVNGATPRTTIPLEAVRALAQHGTVSPVTIHQRINFAASTVDGRTVGEFNPQSRSADEVASLWQYVVTQLRKSNPRA
jgi:chromosome partitioning protein